MKVLFDFEPFGDPNLDVHLVDIMLAMKSELHVLLHPYLTRIGNDAGLILVTITPAKLVVRYHFSSDVDTFDCVQRLLIGIDWREFMERYLKLPVN